MKNKIPVSGPSITQIETDLVHEAAKTAWYENAGKFVREFETNFAIHCNRKFAIALPSCTSGLHLALEALGVCKGDEVIVPDISWIASSAPINYVQASPVFCDIDSKTLCVSDESVLERISPRTKAVIAVNLYGAMPNYDSLEKICSDRGIHLIEDAAESIGSRYKNRPSGNFGSFSVFSFHGSKTLTTGEGGMLLTDSEDLYRKCLILRDHGRVPGDTLFQNNQIGFKYKMSDLQAALGIAQLSRVEQLVAYKRKIHSFYEKNISVPGLNLSFESQDIFNSYWMSTLTWPSGYISKFELINILKEKNVDARPVFSPLSSLKAYESLNLNLKSTNVNSYRFQNMGINLPSALNLTEEQIAYVSSIINSVFEELK